jgi:hypothetical protein
VSLPSVVVVTSPIVVITSLAEAALSFVLVTSLDVITTTQHVETAEDVTTATVDSTGDGTTNSVETGENIATTMQSSDSTVDKTVTTPSDFLWL